MNMELLAPAGAPDALSAAVAEGADAVYLGLRTFNARMRSTNFAFNQFEAATEALHRQGKRVFVTVNTVFEQREADRLWQFLQYLERVGPDAIIVQDFGVAKMAREHFPGLRLHASTQMSVGSAAGANQLSRAGFKRVVLNRELSLEEIRKVREGSGLELETFAHGALCVSASGACLFSSWLGGRSANRGACAQACRRLYKTESSEGFYFSPDDLELVDRIPDLVEAGVSCVKIEGRLKSAEYVGTVVAAYRYMIDNWRFDRERAAAKAKAMLQNDFARRKTTYWFDGPNRLEFLRPEQAGGTGIELGKVRLVRVFDEGRFALLDTFEGIAEGDSVRIHRADDSQRVTARVKEVLNKAEGMFLRLEEEFRVGDRIYLVQTKSMSRRYPSVLPKDLARYRKFPSWETAPEPAIATPARDRLEALPSGLWAMTDRVSALHVMPSMRPNVAVLRLTRKSARELAAAEATVVFKRGSLAIWLEPFCPETEAAWLAPELDRLVEKGQTLFIANNLAHLNMLKGRGLRVIAGPFLYAFNRWSAAWLFEQGVDAIIPPHEISKQALGKLAESIPAKAFLPLVFAWPQLFTIRGDLGEKHDFKYFQDRDDSSYELVPGEEASTVIPSTPFSLVDRIPFLKEEGYVRFLIDFSFVELQKSLYRKVMKAAIDGKVLPDTSRFNWKEGFWAPEEEKRKEDGDSRPRGIGVRPRDAERFGLKVPGEGKPSGEVAKGPRAGSKGATRGPGSAPGTGGSGRRASGEGRKGGGFPRAVTGRDRRGSGDERPARGGKSTPSVNRPPRSDAAGKAGGSRSAKGRKPTRP